MKLLTFVLSLWLLSAGQAQARDDWQLLLFTIPGCSSCALMRDQVIQPMIEVGIIKPDQFEEMIERSSADWQYVRGVGYKQIRELKQTYQTSLFPTLVVIDGNGKRLTENIVGMTSVEHYRTLMQVLVKQLNDQP